MFTETSVRFPAVARRTALIVEDDPRLQSKMSAHLRRLGFDVLSALHYEAAIGHLATREAHVVCVDVSLPAKSGYELCEHIRGPLGLLTVPIIVTGESGHAHDMAFAEAAGANAFLRKPFTRLQLTACVSSLLDRSARVPRPTHELAPLGLATLAQGLNRLTPQIVPGARDGLALPLAALPVRWPAVVEADVVEPRRVYSSRALLRPAGLTAL